MKNSIINWDWGKPTEDGLYLACLGDCETEENTQPFRMVQSGAEHMGQYPWRTYNRAFVEKWRGSYKFAKLCVGAEAEE